MTKLNKAMRIVKKRIPKSYHVDYKIYKTIYSLLRSYSKMKNSNYNKMVEFYKGYLSDDETNTYVKTKYWTSNKFNKIHRNNGFQISAIASEFGILFAEDNVGHRPMYELVFLIMHELGHYWLERHNKDSYNERWCDLFAIRWVRKMKKEDLFN